MDSPTSARVDAWLGALRIYKTRSAATAACRAGHVRVDGDRVKAAATVRPGNVVRVRVDGRERVLEVVRCLVKRVGAPVAAEALVDHSPPPPPREERVLAPVRDRGAGRPTKRDRRDLERLRDRASGTWGTPHL